MELKDTRIGIIGGGVVGSAIAASYLPCVKQVRVHDLNPKRSTHPWEEVVWDSDILFLCLPTPQKEGYLECDTSVLDDALARIPKEGWEFVPRVVCIRSTVPIGYTRRKREELRVSNLVHSPEFLTARQAHQDANLPRVCIVGHATCSNHERPEAALTLYDLYDQRFPGGHKMLMTSDESEAVKLFLNGFFSVKLAYMNEINTLTRRLGLDWDSVLRGMLADGRIAQSHTRVPGPDGMYGFGGACLPKDLASLITHLMGPDPALEESGHCVSSAAYNRNCTIDRRRSS